MGANGRSLPVVLLLPGLAAVRPAVVDLMRLDGLTGHRLIKRSMTFDGPSIGRPELDHPAHLGRHAHGHAPHGHGHGHGHGGQRVVYQLDPHGHAEPFPPQVQVREYGNRRLGRGRYWVGPLGREGMGVWGAAVGGGDAMVWASSLRWGD
jgi:hypothetical protein